MASKNFESRISGILQKLQPKILIFTFGASLLPIIFLLGAGWRFVYQPLTDLEKTRLDDQVLAFRGYTAATAKGLQNLSNGYAIWTALYDAVEQRNVAWIKQEVTDQIVFSTDVDTVRVANRQGNNLAEKGDAWRIRAVQQRVAGLIEKQQSERELMASSDRQLLILVTTPIVRTDGGGVPAGNLIIGQTLDDAWLRKFLDFAQPTTKLEIISLNGKLMLSSGEKTSADNWDRDYLIAEVLPTLAQGRSVYRIEPESGVNAIYSPLTSKGKLIAIAKIEITSKYFQKASVILNRAVWIGLGLAIVISVAIAHFLAKQIAKPINQLAERSKTLAAGDLTSPIPGIYSGGEIGQLANAYQEMAQALRSLIDNLEQRVAERTEELELARQTLEERVRERTEELQKKNQALSIASEQLQQVHAESSSKAEQLKKALRNLKKAQAQLVQTEKMSSLGQLVAGIAHEINNPINFIYANLSHVNNYTQDLLDVVNLYQKRYLDPEIQQRLEEIDLDFLSIDLPKILASMQTGTERISQIILTLRNFSRLDEAEMKFVDIHEGIESTLLILQHCLKMSDGLNIQVIKQYGNLPLIECYPRQMNQVFMNIITNAIDALKEKIINNLENFNNKLPTILIQTEQVDSNLIWVRVWDNGSGIAPAIKDKIFDPFFTTKPVGKGTGLGLSICYQIIERHGGRIDVMSETAQGTEFAIALPINAAKFS